MDIDVAAVGLFAIAAIGGLIMAVRIFLGKTAPVLLSVLHFLFAASGLVTLGYFVLQNPNEKLALTALGIFLVAALGGLFLATFHFRGKFPPKAVVALHALLAVSAFGVLAVGAFDLV